MAAGKRWREKCYYHLDVQWAVGLPKCIARRGISWYSSEAAARVDSLKQVETCRDRWRMDGPRTSSVLVLVLVLVRESSLGAGGAKRRWA